MSRQPGQSGFVQQVRGIDASADAARRYLVGTLSPKVAQTEFQAAQARLQAAAAKKAAADATAAAVAAQGAAASAVGQAQNAAQQAANAAGAAVNAQNAANTANQRAGVLELTDVWIANPSSGNTINAPGGWGFMPDMLVTADFGPFPVVVRFSCETVGNVHARCYWNGVEQNFSYRQAQGLASLSFTYAFVPNGAGTIAVGWMGGGAYSLLGRRQMSVHRIATP